VLVQIPTTLSVAVLAKQIKGSASHLVNHQLKTEAEFKWQGGYGAFTVSKSVGRAVREYILNQEEHHRSGTTSKDMEVAWEEQPGD
jgi:putative transposase